jgi:uncharacterized RDD family membrane protein YckC
MNVLPEDAPRPREPGDFPPVGVNSLAGFWARAAARIFDVIIVGIPALLVVVPFVTIKNDKVTATPDWAVLPFIGLFAAYEIVLGSWTGQTLGKMLCGVRVAQLVNGRRPEVGQAALRALLPLTVLAVPVLAFTWPLIYMTAIFSPLGRGVHDYAGGTVVVRSR